MLHAHATIKNPRRLVADEEGTPFDLVESRRGGLREGGFSGMTIAERSGVEMTVTVVTRNRARVLGHCLRALADQSLDPSRYEMVVVDDGSTDETTAVITAAQRQARCQIRAFRFPEHRGLSAVRNRSVREARGAVIVFVDSDGLVPRSFLSVHLAAHREGDGDLICRGPIVTVDSLHHPFAARWSLLDLNTSFFDTSNASVRREHLLRAGLFDQLLADWEASRSGYGCGSWGSAGCTARMRHYIIINPRSRHTASPSCCTSRKIEPGARGDSSPFTPPWKCV